LKRRRPKRRKPGSNPYTLVTLGALAFVGLLVAVLSAATIPAQTGPSEPDQAVIRVSVNRVQLEVQTTDSKGHHVTDLRAEDFEILDNGKPQKITNCAYVRLGGGTASAQTVAATAGQPESRPPIPSHELAREQVQRTIVLLVDDESFKPETVPYVRKALKTIIEQQIEPRDLVALVRTTSGEGALDQFTSDKDLLLASAERVRWKPMGRGSPGMESLATGHESRVLILFDGPLTSV
jgi:VWFA-related protein